MYKTPFKKRTVWLEENNSETLSGSMWKRTILDQK